MPHDATPSPDPMELLNRLEHCLPDEKCCDKSVDSICDVHRTLPALRSAIEARENETLKVASLYGSALIAFGDAGSFLFRAKEKAFDRFDGCIYCGFHRERNHAAYCALVRFEKVILRQKTLLDEATTPTPKGG